MPWSEALKSRCFVWHLPTFTYSHARATDSRLAVLFCFILCFRWLRSFLIALSTPNYIRWTHSNQTICNVYCCIRINGSMNICRLMFVLFYTRFCVSERKASSVSHSEWAYLTQVEVGGTIWASWMHRAAHSERFFVFSVIFNDMQHGGHCKDYLLFLSIVRIPRKKKCYLMKAPTRKKKKGLEMRAWISHCWRRGRPPLFSMRCSHRAANFYWKMPIVWVGCLLLWRFVTRL